MKNDVNKTNAMIKALDNTGVRMFMYYPQSKSITVPEKTCEAYQCRSLYENMPYSFAEDFVYEEDYTAFEEMYYEIDRGARTATATFRSKDLNYCHQVTLTTISWDLGGKPVDVFGLIEDKSEQFKKDRLISRLQEELLANGVDKELEEHFKATAFAIGGLYFGIYYVSLQNRTYICFQSNRKETAPAIGEKGAYEPAWYRYIDNFIDERDRAGARAFLDIDLLKDRLVDVNTVSYDYRRKGTGWTRGRFIVAGRDADGRPVDLVYLASDINEEIETKRKKEEAEIEALRDPLTGMWNRKAFEQFKESADFRSKQCGVLVFDVDRFKAINDQFGHDAGDKVIINVAQTVKGIMRQKDMLFRMGGDEFLLLLYNCNETVWQTTCRKIEDAHSTMKKTLPREVQVTISAGLCINTDGYCDKMYKLADKALFNTKANGRGGCTMIGLDGEICNEWHDSSGLLRKGDVLEKNSTVTWRLDKPKKDGLPYLAYGDELYCAFVGLDRTASPEKLYKAWEERVEPDNFDIIREAARIAVVNGNVEVVFSWRHPQKGTVLLRCSASLEKETDDYYSFVGYIHVVTGTRVVTMEDIDSKIKNAMEEMYYANFYIRLTDYSFRVFKAQSYMEEMLSSSANAKDAIDSYITYMVADESKASMESFLNLTTIRQRLRNNNIVAENYYDPNIGWSRASLIAVDRDEAGEVETVSLVVEALR